MNNHAAYAAYASEETMNNNNNENKQSSWNPGVFTLLHVELKTLST